MRAAFTISICSILALSSISIINTAQAKHKERYDYQNSASKVLHRTYIGVKGGVSVPVAFSLHQIKDLNSSAVYGGLAGYRFNKWFRSDVEINHRHESAARRDSVVGNNIIPHTSTITSTLFMLNGYFMLPQMYAQPFMTAGVGVASNKVGDYKISNTVQWSGDKKTAFAYQAGAGLTFSHENIDVDGTVQYVNRGEGQTKANTTSGPRKVTIKDFVFSMSLRYNL
ncbi:MAG: outer membrane beta-barrel protein [Rickettsiales bacterium]|nr:outer membrane beta-barrel protein [Rickettsiales bacterium]